MCPVSRGLPSPARIIYLGGYVDEEIARERGLRSHNVAGSNRMARIGHALAVAGLKPVLISPATSLRANGAGGCLFPVRVRRAGDIPVVFAAMVNITGLNILASPLLQFLALRGLLRKGGVAGAVIYNFNPSLVLLTAYLKFVWGIKLVQNVEDISEPKLRDWLPNSETRPIQQLVYWICQNLVARMVDDYVVPAQRFLDHLPKKPASVVVTGCISIQGDASRPSASPLRVLYAGKIEREHGIHVFLSALLELDRRNDVPRIEVDITGTGEIGDWVVQQINELRFVRVKYHGFVSNREYRKLVQAADICVALQDPKGRHASFKTPSKVYEFLGFGKAVIATDVGDIASLGANVLIVLPELTPNAVARALETLAASPEATTALRLGARAHAEHHFSYEAVGSVLRELLTSHKGRRP